MKYIPPLTATLLVLVVSWYFDAGKMFGAHPWWSHMTLAVGGGIGLALGLVAAFFVPKIWRVLGFAVLCALAVGVACWGGNEFAASYAENAAAGKAWYFGWYSVWAGAAALLFSLISPSR